MLLLLSTAGRATPCRVAKDRDFWAGEPSLPGDRDSSRVEVTILKGTLCPSICSTSSSVPLRFRDHEMEARRRDGSSEELWYLALVIGLLRTA